MMKARNSYIEQEDGADGAILRLRGDWIIDRSAELLAILKAQPQNNIASIDAAQMGRMDTWGAMHVRRLAIETGAALSLSDRQKQVFEFLPEDTVVEKPQESGFFSAPVETVGATTVSFLQATYGIISFIGEIALCFVRNLARPSHFRFHSIVRHIDETGLKALPIVALLAILISMVISYQAAMQLGKFGANIFTVDLTVISLLREMGVLITAIMVAGRSGSAFAAEIGVMKLREEIDALKTMGFNPIEILVLPRLIAMMITLPVLTFLADITGLVGSGIISMFLLDIPLEQYISRVEGVAKPTMFFVGMIKAPVFAFVITIIGTYQGMNVSGSAESVGRLTTVAVVQSIFLVIMVDALFSIIFANLGI